MSGSNYQFYLIYGYVILFAVITMGVWVWRIKRRRQRPPMEFKLLRAPGESLRRRVAKFDEHGLFYLAGAALLPVLVSIPAITGFQDVWKTPTWSQFYVRIAIAVLTSRLAPASPDMAPLGISLRGRNKLSNYGKNISSTRPTSRLGS